MRTYAELKQLIEQRGVHLVFGEPGEGLAVEQNPAELAEFLVVCQELGVSSVLEIGTGYKAGLARFLDADMQWQVMSVDIQDYGHTFGNVTFLTLAQAENMPMIGKPDLLLLDGDHSYEGVKHDYETYGHIAAKVIAFHDIAGLRECEGVRQYWIEVSRYPALIEGGSIVISDWDLPLKTGCHEILETDYQKIFTDGIDRRGGIGYIVLAETNSEPEPSLFVDMEPISAEEFHKVQDFDVEDADEETYTRWMAEKEAAKVAAPVKKPTPRKRTPGRSGVSNKKPAARTAKK